MISQYMKDRMDRKNGIKDPLPTRKEKKPVPKMSAKKKDTDGEYKKMRKVFLNANPRCEANLRDCQKVSLEVHHSRGRGEYMLDVSTWKALCSRCHSYLETHPDESRKLGFTNSRLSIHDHVNGKTVKVIDSI